MMVRSKANDRGKGQSPRSIGSRVEQQQELSSSLDETFDIVDNTNDGSSSRVTRSSHTVKNTTTRKAQKGPRPSTSSGRVGRPRNINPQPSTSTTTTGKSRAPFLTSTKGTVPPISYELMGMFNLNFKYTLELLDDSKTCLQLSSSNSTTQCCNYQIILILRPFCRHIKRGLT